MYGLGNQRTILELAKIMRAQDPPVLFLVKTWAGEVRLKNFVKIYTLMKHGL